MNALAKTRFHSTSCSIVKMPRLDDSRGSLMHAGDEIERRAKRAWGSFSDFALRDNVLEVAVGLM